MSLHRSLGAVPLGHASLSSKKWDTHKESIRQMYIEQNMPLKDVMRTLLERHGFSASVRMYKIRLSKWKFVKNNNRQNMEALARHIIKRRRLATAEQRPQTDDRLVEDEEVTRYFRRKGFKSLEDAVEGSKSKSRISGGFLMWYMLRWNLGMVPSFRMIKMINVVPNINTVRLTRCACD